MPGDPLDEAGVVLDMLDHHVADRDIGLGKVLGQVRQIGLAQLVAARGDLRLQGVARHGQGAFGKIDARPAHTQAQQLSGDRAPAAADVQEGFAAAPL